jgi:uncharacterized membrane protein YdbT with pleckstrin-like domain
VTAGDITNAQGQPPRGESERSVWVGGPSQWINFPTFVLSGLLVAGLVAAGLVLDQVVFLGLAAIPLIVAIWKWLDVQCTNLELTSERIKTQTGILSRRKHELELFRVKDTFINQPFLLRLVGLANIDVISSDKTTPRLMMHAIQEAESVKELIRTHVQRLRLRTGVREVDFE